MKKKLYLKPKIQIVSKKGMEDEDFENNLEIARGLLRMADLLEQSARVLYPDNPAKWVIPDKMENREWEKKYQEN